MKRTVAKADKSPINPLNKKVALGLIIVHKNPAIIVAGRDAKLTKELQRPKTVAFISLGELLITKVLELIAIKLKLKP